MSFRYGLVIALLSVVSGYLGNGGNVAVLFQPFEWLTIIGVAIGSFVMSNPFSVQRLLWGNIHKVFKKAPYSKDDHIQVLLFLFNFFKFAHANGAVEVEKHIDNPRQSTLFRHFLHIPESLTAIEFFCDYFRMLVLGFNKTYEMESIMDKRINEKRTKVHEMALAVQKLGDSLPALGIVVAVLGVITAMGAVGATADVLAMRIASALVGTFIGVFMSYGMVTPIGLFLAQFCLEELIIYECIKVAIISHMNGDTPSVSVEFARHILPEDVRPTFTDLENNISFSLTQKGKVKIETTGTAA